MESRRSSDLGLFFEPRSVAVFGSLRQGDGEGYVVIDNMLKFGFTGNIYPVNPSYSQVLGIRAYPAVNDVPGPVDLAVVITPPATVAGVIRQCAQKGIRAAIIVTEGFAETGEAGARLQEQVADIARSHGMRLIGPNTIGIINSANGLVTNPYRIGYDRVRRGSIAYSSQSGVIGASAQPLEDRAYPISKMCDFGNKCDVDEADWLDYLVHDAETKVIAMHIECVRGGRRFLDVLRRVSDSKPVVVLKAGRTEPGARASASHTGSLAGSEKVGNDVFRQFGAITVNTLQEFWDIPKVFASQPLPGGNRIAIVSPSGGTGVMAIDAAVESGLVVAQLTRATLDRLSKFPANLARNPCDVGPSMVLSEDRQSVQETALGALLGDANVDCAAIALYAGPIGSITDTANIMDELRQRVSKPMAIWIYGPKLSMREDLALRLEAMGLPTYLELQTAVKALAVAAEYAQARLDRSRVEGFSQ